MKELTARQVNITDSFCGPLVLRMYETIPRVWSAEGGILEFNFDMSIQLRRAHPKVKGHAGKVAITSGPLVYCLERG